MAIGFRTWTIGWIDNEAIEDGGGELTCALSMGEEIGKSDGMEVLLGKGDWLVRVKGAGVLAIVMGVGDSRMSKVGDTGGRGGPGCGKWDGGEPNIARLVMDSGVQWLKNVTWRRWIVGWKTWWNAKEDEFWNEIHCQKIEHKVKWKLYR